jgi:hypothetical protein
VKDSLGQRALRARAGIDASPVCRARALGSLVRSRKRRRLELDGSIFDLYAPCNGEMLARVVRRLEDVARRRPIVVCTVGLEFQGVPWLLPRRSSSVSLSIYDSRR